MYLNKWAVLGPFSAKLYSMVSQCNPSLICKWQLDPCFLGTVSVNLLPLHAYKFFGVSTPSYKQKSDHFKTIHRPHNCNPYTVSAILSVACILWSIFVYIICGQNLMTSDYVSVLLIVLLIVPLNLTNLSHWPLTFSKLLIGMLELFCFHNMVMEIKRNMAHKRIEQREF